MSPKFYYAAFDPITLVIWGLGRTPREAEASVDVRNSGEAICDRIKVSECTEILYKYVMKFGGKDAIWYRRFICGKHVLDLTKSLR